MVDEQTNHPVTRLEILDAVDKAFEAPPTATSDILVTAEDSGARTALLEVLHRLPEKRFGSVRELWEHLPDVPVEA
ncbi:hypothetical protein J2S53_003290 [Actinopolyspora lacussalsi]|nr:hypothetical protein [Actinopolyspora lacussalsi]